MFSIVKFIESNKSHTVEVVPTAWFKKGVCRWPNYKTDRFHRAVKRLEPPGEDWLTYDASIIKSFDSYEGARSWLPRAELTSDLSELEGVTLGRRRKKVGKPKELQFDLHSEDEVSMPTVTADLRKSAYTLPTPPIFTPIEATSTTEQHSTSLEGEGITFEEPHLTGVADLKGILSQHQGTYLYTVPEGNYALGNTQFLENSGPTDDDFKKKVIDSLEDLKISIKQIHAKLDKIPDRSERSMPKAICEIESALPMKSVDEVNGMNEAVKSITSRRQALVKKVEVIRMTGGSDCRQAVRCAIKKLMTKEVSVKYSGAGAKGKLRFLDLEYKAIIFDALKLRSELHDVNEKAVADEITKYLPKIADSIKYHRVKQSRNEGNHAAMRDQSHSQ